MNSREDEFDFEITSIREEIDDKEKESGDEMKSVKKKRKIKIEEWMRESWMRARYLNRS